MNWARGADQCHRSKWSAPARRRARHIGKIDTGGTDVTFAPHLFGATTPLPSLLKDLARCLMMSMTSAIWGALLTALVVTPPQELPNFAGRWTLAGDGSHPEQSLIVSQTATSLSVENWSGSGPFRGVYVWPTESQQAGSATPVAKSNGTTFVVVFPPANGPVSLALLQSAQNLGLSTGLAN